MKKLSLFIASLILLVGYEAKTQNVTVTDNDSYTPEESAMLDVSSTDKGLLVPRLTTSQRTGISTPATGLLVFDTDINAFFYYAGATDGWLNLSSQIISPASAAENDPLFSVVNDDNDTVFAVYPEGVYIWVGDGTAKGNRGGFAVGGLSSGGKLPLYNENFLEITPGEVRIRIDTLETTKGNRGGFAVGGLSSGTKAPLYDFMQISPGDVKFYVDTANGGKPSTVCFLVCCINIYSYAVRSDH
jgi:hypothetical protein